MPHLVARGGKSPQGVDGRNGVDLGNFFPYKIRASSSYAGADGTMSNSNSPNLRFLRRLADGSSYHLGTAVYYPNGAGWRFVSNVSSHKSSRKFHPTMQQCLPRWVGYPDKCESVPVSAEGSAAGEAANE
jgi:hypothetical protein